MSRIEATFQQLKATGRQALIPYVTAGFPFADVTPELMHAMVAAAMVAAGADVIELGVPFSDPSADGPVIQKAGDKALAFGIGTSHVIDMVKAFRQTNTTTPVVLMGYANPIQLPASTASWWWTTPPRNALNLRLNCGPTAWT
ncbi:MAG: Tryptophan synthase alpha chain [Pseudomonadota bacterium]